MQADKREGREKEQREREREIGRCIDSEADSGSERESLRQAVSRSKDTQRRLQSEPLTRRPLWGLPRRGHSLKLNKLRAIRR